jgi:hypothetical protein
MHSRSASPWRRWPLARQRLCLALAEVGQVQEVYLHVYDSVTAARNSIPLYIRFLDTRRPHAALDRRTTDAMNFNSLSFAAKARFSVRNTVTARRAHESNFQRTEIVRTGISE